MYRYLAVLVLVAGCDRGLDDPRPHPVHSDPDAGQCELGEFAIAAPVDGEHYDKSLDVLVDESELWNELSVTIADDIGDTYLPTSESTEPYPADAGTWWNRDTYHFELAASTRYTLAVSHCSTYQRVAFFTSP